MGLKMKPISPINVVKLLRVYRSHGLGLGAAFTRLGNFKSKHGWY